MGNSKIEAVRQKGKEFQQAIKEAAKKGVLKEFFLEAFEALPKEVKALRWHQYTPHFNDGDACVFGIGEPDYLLEGAPEDAGDNEDGWQDAWSLKYDKKLTAAQEKILQDLYHDMQEIEEVLEMTFGDGYQITVYRDGKIEVEEFDHD